VIALMGRKYVQNDWPQLFSGIINYLTNSQELTTFKTIFECVKKICKKYRYMFRSDALYSEMNYVIENLSSHLISTFCTCLNMAKDDANSGNEMLIKNLYSVMNSVLHIIESILSQEELPDFYEENLPMLTDGC
jgi:archaellum biogenesis protein FlaJ (TadC family)